MTINVPRTIPTARYTMMLMIPPSFLDCPFPVLRAEITIHVVANAEDYANHMSFTVNILYFIMLFFNIILIGFSGNSCCRALCPKKIANDDIFPSRILPM